MGTEEILGMNALCDKLVWVVLIIGPVILFSAFWFIHEIPAKIAKKRNHTYAEAIHVTCLLSLFIGGMLFPFAFIWAYVDPEKNTSNKLNK